jgi:enoyl-CoA hydratase/carnithine racemase
LSSSVVRLDTTPPLGIITIERPEVRNALNTAAWHELAARLDEVRRAFPVVRVLLLRGAGTKAFVAGADIEELNAVVGDLDRSRAYVELVESVMKRLESLPQTVIALVNGDAVGAGLELMAACDLRIVAEGARLGIPATKLGLAITGQDLQRLERLVGLGRVKWLLLTGRLVEANVGLSWGVVDAIYSKDELEEQASALALEIAANSASSNRLTKAALRTYTDAVGQGDEAGFACSLPAWKSRSLVEGIRAFVERRSPDFPAVESANLD